MPVNVCVCVNFCVSRARLCLAHVVFLVVPKAVLVLVHDGQTPPTLPLTETNAVRRQADATPVGVSVAVSKGHKFVVARREAFVQATLPTNSETRWFGNHQGILFHLKAAPRL